MLSAVASLVYPIATYLVTLSTFGVAHVLIELRYIDTQYFTTLKRQFDPSFLFWLVNLLLGIASLHCLRILDWMPDSLGLVLELCCGLGLVLLAIRVIWQQIGQGEGFGDGLRKGVAVAIAILLIVGIYQSPVTTLAILAIIHNLTPIGFIYHRLKGNQSYWLSCLVVFGLLPFLIFNLRWLGASWLSAEINSPYLATFIPPIWQQGQYAYPLFAAVTFCQCMHYAAVIGLFSQWTRSNSESLISWIRDRYFYLAIWAASALLFLAFQKSFFTTRAFYGVLASIHAWVEIPLLLVLLTTKQIEYQPTQK
jgi:hypothetical protein